ncbi:MAG: hypothetical protein HY069_00780 [Chlamydiia bacterium]|nr:hypothetical protein [Chlamydiia bacterium]
MTKKRKGFYEGMYILSAALSDDSRKKALEKITDGIAQKSVQELWKEYHLHEDLIRFITMRVEKVPETLEFQPLKIQG